MTNPAKRRLAIFALAAPMALAAAFAALLLAPPHAVAQSLSGIIDPTQISTVQGQVANWTSQAQGFAYRLYTALFIFELIVVAITTLLFRENIGEFFSSITLKILMGGVFMYLIVNAGTFFPAVIQSFTQAGQSMGGSSSPWAMIGLGLVTAVGFYAAAAAGHGEDSLLSSTVGIMVLGSGDPGTAMAAADGHTVFAAMCQFLGFVMLLAFAGIALQFILTTIESYIVMSAGIIFIGFAGSRFTMPFSQGYFSYVISAGTKLFTLYLILGIEQNILPGVILTGGAAVAAASLIPYGAGDAIAIGLAAWASIQVIIACAICWAVPNFAASFLSGSSSLSAGALMSQVASQSTGLQQTIAGALGNRGHNGAGGAHALHAGGGANGAAAGVGIGALIGANGSQMGGAANAAEYAQQVGSNGAPGTNGGAHPVPAGSSFVNAAAGNSGSTPSLFAAGVAPGGGGPAGGPAAVDSGGASQLSGSANAPTANYSNNSSFINSGRQTAGLYTMSSGNAVAGTSAGPGSAGAAGYNGGNTGPAGDLPATSGSGVAGGNPPSSLASDVPPASLSGGGPPPSGVSFASGSSGGGGVVTGSSGSGSASGTGSGAGGGAGAGYVASGAARASSGSGSSSGTGTGTGSTGTGDASAGGAQRGTYSDNGTLEHMSVERMKSLSPAEFRQRLERTSYLTEQQRSGISNDPQLAQEFKDAQKGRGGEEGGRRSNPMNPNAIPRDSVTVSAAQIRLGSPDKL